MIQKVRLYLFIVVVLFSVGCQAKLPIETNLSEEVGDFSFTNEQGEEISRDDLKGNWWIADFIFTNCTTACLPMTTNMSTLQDRLKEENIDIQLVSFSVDPNFDTPEVLKAYGDEYGADFTNWHFLTGYDFQTIKELSIKSFRAMLQEPELDDDQFIHDTRFFLIDPKGNIVKGYSGLESKNVELIIDDLLLLEDAGLIHSL